MTPTAKTDNLSDIMKNDPQGKTFYGEYSWEEMFNDWVAHGGDIGGFMDKWISQTIQEEVKAERGRLVENLEGMKSKCGHHYPKPCKGKPTESCWTMLHYNQAISDIQLFLKKPEGESR